MSNAWNKVIIARLMIAECDAILDSLDDYDLVQGFRQDTKVVTKIRRDYWEKVLAQESLQHSLEGGS